MSEITMNDHGLDIARAAHEKWYAPIREYLRTAPQSATATKLNRRRSHGELLELRSRSIYGLVLTLREVGSQYAERTTEAQGPVGQGLSSSLHCHGPPRDMVRGISQALTNQTASTVRRTRESLTV
jgi:hypothetical protein